MQRISLDGDWTLRVFAGDAPEVILDRDVPAQVPGCVHLDLWRAGLIGDPFDGDNEAAQQWIGDCDWEFRRELHWPGTDDNHVELVAAGLDTVATILLNGHVLAMTQNQHRSYRFPVGHLLRRGGNDLVVRFAGPVAAAERFAASQGGELPHVFHHPFNALRKSASDFGWDWGIDVAGAGIWRPIAIETWTGARIDTVRPLVDVVEGTGVLRAHVTLGEMGPKAERRVQVTLRHDGNLVAERSTPILAAGVVTLVVPDVAVWWPIGYGAQPLYDLEVAVGASVWRSRVGFRTVDLDVTPDEHGTPFVLRVNGQPIRVRGANWIPDDAFPTRVTRERLGRRVNDAIEANMNLLRVWGGGHYESDDFFDICDERGVLVWQDFLFACAAYPETAAFIAEVDAEAREAVTRLSPHPSLVLWNGNNENQMAWVDWDWREQLKGRPWGDQLYRSTLPGIVAELDPTRPYIPGSPTSLADYLHPNLESTGPVHVWDVWNSVGYEHYRDWRPRFVAEFGFQGAPAWTTLSRVVHDDPITPTSHDMSVHQKAEGGHEKLRQGLVGHFPAPRSIGDWHLATQLNQAQALHLGITWFRSLAPYNSGTIIWQLNDDWPVVSWAIVDHAEQRKPAWYAVRAAYAPRLLTVQPADEGLAAILVNDTETAYSGRVDVRRLTFAGDELAEASWIIDVPAHGVRRIPLPIDLAESSTPSGEILVAEASGFERAIWDYADVVDQDLTADAVSATAEHSASGAIVRVRAHSYVRGLVLQADRAHPDAASADQWLNLLPGEDVTIAVRAPGISNVDALVAPDVLRHAGQLVQRIPRAARPRVSMAR